MNIAFDAGAVEIAKGSGMGNYTLNQFENMLRLYPEHHFYYFNIIEDSPLADRFADFPNFHKCYFYPGKDNVLQRHNGDYHALFGGIVRNFLKKNHIDVFYITAPFIALNALYKKEWFDGVTVVATIYDLIPFIMRKKYLPTKETLDWYMACVDMLKWTDRQLTISDYTKSDMVKHLHFDPEKIDVISGGVSDRYKVIPITQDEKAAVYNTWHIQPHSEFFLCGVSADRRKNAEGIIKAYALLPKDLRNRYQMVIAGRLGDREKNEAQIRRLGVEGRVILTDYIKNDDELIKLYNLSKFVVIPSLYEGFGLPIVEAWSCGKAVLASNNSSLGELVGDAGITFDPYDIRDMTRALTEALTTADLPALARRGREKLPQFRWENVAQLSMAAITKARSDKPVYGLSEKKRLACVFVCETHYNDAWQAFLTRLTAQYITDIYMTDLPQDEPGIETRYDGILYFTPAHRLSMLGDIVRYPKGVWVVLDADMERALALMTRLDTTDDYFGPIEKELPAHFCERIIVAGEDQKTALLSNPNLLGKVYCISPFRGEDTQTPPDAIDNYGDRAFCNFLGALSDECVAPEPFPLLEQLRTREIEAKAYTTEEISDLSVSIGFAFSTEPAGEPSDKGWKIQ